MWGKKSLKEPSLVGFLCQLLLCVHLSNRTVGLGRGPEGMSVPCVCWGDGWGSCQGMRLLKSLAGWRSRAAAGMGRGSPGAVSDGSAHTQSTAPRAQLCAWRRFLCSPCKISKMSSPCIFTQGSWRQKLLCQTTGERIRFWSSEIPLEKEKCTASGCSSLPWC